MIFGKFTIKVDPKYLNGIPSGCFVGQSVPVGKVFLGNFRKRFSTKSIDADMYKSAYANGDQSRSHKKLDDYARRQSVTEHTMRCIIPQYVEIRAVWTGAEWRYSDPVDMDITTNGDGIRLQATITETVDPFIW